MRHSGQSLYPWVPILKRRLTAIAIVVASVVLPAPPVPALERTAAVVARLADGFTTPDGIPYHLGGSSGAFYFSLSSHLWKTDGSRAGTTVVGTAATPLGPHIDGLLACLPFCPHHFPEGASANGLFFFAADDGVHGSELWKSDGTPGGTSMVQDLGATPFDPYFVAVGGLVYFLRGNPPCAPECELWRSDGTPGGTLLLTSIPPAPPWNRLIGAGVNGLLLFQKGSDIWSSDGTVIGTALLKSGAELFVETGGKLFFTSGTHLWATDGTIPGNVELTSFPVFLHKCVSGACYFSDGTSGLQGLWKSDGTPGGTLELTDTAPNGPIPEFADVNGTVFFPNGSELWKTDGTPGGTGLVAAVGFAQKLVSAYGQLFFINSDQLWKSDGTAAGTGLVKDFGADQTLAEIIVVAGKLLLYVAGPQCPIGQPCVQDWHVYRSDGTPAGTQVVKDVARSVFVCPTPLCSANNLVPPNSTVIGDKWFFTALDAELHEPRLWVATHVYFGDVAPDYWAFAFVERLADAGITVGCNPERYCPEDSVTRAQMAVLLERAKNGPDFIPPPGTGTLFADVPASYWALDWIEQLLADGITGGCGTAPLVFCPNKPVTRAEMAIFLLKGEHGAAYAPPPVGADTGFDDVPATHWAAAWIVQLAVEGITGGCAAARYCPEDPVTRAQMAVFLLKTFGPLP
jgi:ELWxxDGT repeat protein